MATPDTVRRGDTGETVSYLQYELVRAGLLEGPLEVDGDFGPATEAAVITFQTNEGIDADGIVGPITWGRFLNHHPLPPTLQEGSAGEVVRSLQNVLNRAFAGESVWEVLAEDGDFGPKTAQGVRIFQKVNEIPLDAIVVPQTWSGGPGGQVPVHTLAEAVGV